MADGRRQATWEHTAAIAAAALSAMRETPVHPDKLNPYADDPPPTGGLALTSENIEVLKEWLD
jgi:hypothetical protein